MTRGPLSFCALPGVPEIAPGADLADVALASLALARLALSTGDMLVFAQKIVSKAEGRFVDLRDVQPSTRALELAARCDKDPRLVELVLAESTEVVRVAPNVLLTRHRCGFVMANAGIDHSNVGDADGELVLLLPLDADASARGLRAALELRTRSWRRASSSATASAAPGATARSTSRSVLPACLRWSTCAVAWTGTGARCSSRKWRVADAIAAGAGPGDGRGDRRRADRARARLCRNGARQ